jgi:NAD(P)-dependent dehydrogenase (short-subunit alcohol dehydrogenase family)
LTDRYLDRGKGFSNGYEYAKAFLERGDAVNGQAIHQDRVTVITGAGLGEPNPKLVENGADRPDLLGLGAAMALEFGRQGSHVVCVDYVGENAVRLAERIKAEGGEATPYTLDVTDAAATSAFFDDFGKIADRFDTLINNVGAYRVVSNPLALSDEEWEASISLNLTAAFRMTRNAVTKMKEFGKGGVAAFLASDAAIKGAQKCESCYTAAKGGIVAFSKSVSRGGRADGIRSFSLCPGPCNTPGLWMNWTKEAVDDMKAQMFSGRLIEPEHVAILMATLCHPELVQVNLAAYAMADGLTHH